jgi:hypothetical protein
MLLLWSAVLTLAALVLAALEGNGWWPGAAPWILGTVGAAALLLAAWFIHARGQTPARLARKLDSRWLLHARLESATELAGDQTTWADALRENASQSMRGRRLPGMRAWRSGQAALLGLAALLLAEGAALGIRSLRSASASAAAGKPAPADEVHGSIEWKTPESEIKATAIEEVPLTALADSNTGFRSLSLETIVNGERELSRPLDRGMLAEVTKSGAHEITLSLFLDELKLKPFDMVSYRLVAELNTPGAKRVISSPPQFVEIRPPQRDATLTGEVSDFPAQLFDLKSRQLRLIKQNAALAQLSGVADSDPTWAPENTRVASEQEKLAAQAEEVLAAVKAKRLPSLVTENLAAAATAMRSASKDIATKANEAAAKPQNRALALITELQQFLGQALSASGVTSVSDPIRDEQVFQLPPRSETPAGQLEKLAERQQKENSLLSAVGDKGASDKGEAAAEQAAIAQEAARLAASGNYDSTVLSTLTGGGLAAGDAFRQLGLDDPQAARVPAAAAQQAFEAAVEAQEKAGRAIAVAELEQVRRKLNAAARASADERKQRLATARAMLRTAALTQQKTGSAEAARELARLADLIGGDASASGKGAGAVASSPTNSSALAREVAAAAAHAQVQLSARTAAVTRVVRGLNHAGEQLASKAETTADPDVLGNLELAGQEAQWVTGDSATIELAQQLVAQADALLQVGSNEEAKRHAAGAASIKLAAAIEQGRPAEANDQIARHFSPADVDPLYRESVESYFERLSRDARRPAAMPPK